MIKTEFLTNGDQPGSKIQIQIFSEHPFTSVPGIYVQCSGVRFELTDEVLKHLSGIYNQNLHEKAILKRVLSGGQNKKSNGQRSLFV